jgi:hypothetical protein
MSKDLLWKWKKKTENRFGEVLLNNSEYTLKITRDRPNRCGGVICYKITNTTVELVKDYYIIVSI